MEVHQYLNTGADIAIEASGVYKALYEAMRSVRQCGRIVTLGYYKGKDQELALGREWMHNRLTMISSMPTWDNPMREYPLWDVERLTSTLRKMFQRGMLTSEGIVDPVVRFEDAVDAIMHAYRNPSESIKVGVLYGE